MHLVFFLYSSKNGYGFFNTRLFNHDDLETAHQGGILFNMFSVFLQGCCADASNFATRKRRFNEVGCIHGALGATGTDEHMNFIDKKDNIAGISDFLQ